MPLTDQERRCIELACQYLASSPGGAWAISDGQPLEDLHRNEPVPEVLVISDGLTAAVEVKRLTDGVFTAYARYTRSLKDYLAPACGGYYFLAPGIDVRLPLSKSVKQQLRREISRVAPTLENGGKGVVHVPQEAVLSLVDANGPGHVHCCHDVGDSVRQFSGHLSAKFFLADCECWAHSFVTDEGRRAFADVLVATQNARLAGIPSLMRWFEEWELHRADGDDAVEDGVWFMSVTDAHSVPGTVADAVDAMLSKALGKFQRRWADVHVLVFDRASDIVRRDLVEAAISDFTPADLGVLDLILFVDQAEVCKVWPNLA